MRYDKTQRGIFLPNRLWEKADEQCKKRGFKGISKLVEIALRHEIEAVDPSSITQEDNEYFR